MMRFVTPGVFRFILAFIVVIHHNVDFLLIGHAAVYIFFVLSGYWIAKMYKEKYQKLNRSYQTFIISRILRLMPVYYLILIISTITSIVYAGLLSYEGLNTPGFILSNLFVFGLRNAKYMLLGPGWSLDIELQFYLLAPLLLILANKINKKILLPIVVFLSFIYIYFIGNDFITIITYLPLFLIGMYIYLYDIKFNNTIAYSALCVALMLYLIHYIQPDLRNIFLVQPKYKLLGLSYRELLNITLGLLVIPYVTINVRMLTVGKFDNVFSSMSYVIYLLHWPAVRIYSNYITGMNTKEKIPLFIVYVFGCVLVSFLISITYDQYFEKLRKQFIQRNKYLSV